MFAIVKFDSVFQLTSYFNVSQMFATLSGQPLFLGHNKIKMENQVYIITGASQF